jgi:hypothetical protein
MMGEGTARNMYSRLEINKSRIVASCWSSFIIILVMHGHMNVKVKSNTVNHDMYGKMKSALNATQLE